MRILSLVFQKNLTPQSLVEFNCEKNKKIISKTIYLNLLREDDVSETYLNWLHDKEINQFLEVSYHHQRILKN